MGLGWGSLVRAKLDKLYSGTSGHSEIRHLCVRPHKINYLILIHPTYHSQCGGGGGGAVITSDAICYFKNRGPTCAVGVTLPRNNNYSDCQNSVGAGMRIK